MSAHKVCIAGFGQRVSVWLSIRQNKVVEATIDEPKRHEHIELYPWFTEYFLLLPVNPKHGPKTTKICPFLTLQAGKKAAEAFRDYSVPTLGDALRAQYGWQIANGAKSLPARGALAKIYAGDFAVYLFEKRPEEQTALRKRPLLK